MLELELLTVRLAEPHAAAYPESSAYIEQVCPVCERPDDSTLLASIRCGEQTSLESAFCRRCEHRYFRKLPGQNWYQQYYANEWDAGRIGVGGRLGKAKRGGGGVARGGARGNLSHQCNFHPLK